MIICISGHFLLVKNLAAFEVGYIRLLYTNKEFHNKCNVRLHLTGCHACPISQYTLKDVLTLLLWDILLTHLGVLGNTPLYVTDTPSNSAP